MKSPQPALPYSLRRAAPVSWLRAASSHRPRVLLCRAPRLRFGLTLHLRFRLPLHLELGRTLLLRVRRPFRPRLGLALRLGFGVALRLSIALRLRLGLRRFGRVAPGLCLRLDPLSGRLLARLHYNKISDGGSGRDERPKYRRYEHRATFLCSRGLRQGRVRELDGLVDRRSSAFLDFGTRGTPLEPRPVGSRHGAGAAVVRGGAAAQFGGLAARFDRVPE